MKNITCPDCKEEIQVNKCPITCMCGATLCPSCGGVLNKSNEKDCHGISLYKMENCNNPQCNWKHCGNCIDKDN